MRATQHATNEELVALMAKIEAEENSAAREYQSGEWVSMNEETIDDFNLELY